MSGAPRHATASDLVPLRDVCAPRTRPVDHVRALIRAGRLPSPAAPGPDGGELVPSDFLDGLDPAGRPAPPLDDLPPGWRDHVERGIARYVDGTARPRERHGDRLLGMAGGAWITGLGLLMAGHAEDADEWLERAAICYRRSLADAEPGSWGRSIAAVKARLIACDWRGAEREARWTLDLGAAAEASPIARYAASLSCLVLGLDEQAGKLAASLDGEDAFPDGIGRTATALKALAGRDSPAYATAIREVLRSFEERTRFLEKVPVADTVIGLERIAQRRRMDQRLVSSRLPGPEAGRTAGALDYPSAAEVTARVHAAASRLERSAPPSGCDPGLGSAAWR